MFDITQKSTSLSKTKNVTENLKWKLERLQEDNLPVQTGLADYIALTIDELDMQTNQIKMLIKEAQSRKKELEEQKQEVATGSAEFLKSMGIDKLEGNIVSSVTIQKGKEAAVKEKFTRDCTIQEMEACLLNAGLGHLESIGVPAAKDKIKINKRRVIVPEVEGDER